VQYMTILKLISFTTVTNSIISTRYIYSKRFSEWPFRFIRNISATFELNSWFLLTKYHDYYIILSSYLRPIIPFLRLRESAYTAMPLLAVLTLHSDRWHSSDDPVTGDRICIFSIIIPTIRKENKHIRVVPKGVARAMSDVSTVQIKADRAQLTRYTCIPHHRPYLDSRVLHDKPHMYIKVQNM